MRQPKGMKLLTGINKIFNETPYMIRGEVVAVFTMYYKFSEMEKLLINGNLKCIRASKIKVQDIPNKTGLSLKKGRKAREELKRLNLIEDIQIRGFEDSGAISDHRVIINL